MCSAEALPKNLESKIGTLDPPDFRAMLDALPMAVYVTDREGFITYFNQAAADLAGREPELGKDRWCVGWELRRTDGSILPHEECPMAQTLKEGRAIRGHGIVAVRPDGTMVPLLACPTPMFDKSGMMTGAINLLVDISERQRQQAEQDSQFLAAIVESSDDAIVSKDLNGIITSWNKGAERLFGYAADEVIGKSITILIPAGHEDEEPHILDRIRNGVRIDHYETKRQRKDGSLVDISLTVSPVRDVTGRIVGASKIARNITEQKQAERTVQARLREQASLYRLTEKLHRAKGIEEIYDAALDAIRAALNCSRASILLFDQSDTMRFVAWSGLSEHYRHAVDGHSPWTPDARDPDPIFVEDMTAAELSDDLRATIASEGIAALGFIPLIAGGRLIGKFMAYYDKPHVFSETEVSLALTIARQLGFSIQRIRAERARQLAEEQLRRNEASERARAAELQAIMEAVPTPIWITRTPDCRVIDGNRSAYELLHLPPASNLSFSAPADERPSGFQIFSAGRMLSAHELPVQRAARGEEVENFEQEIRFEDGRTRHLLGNATPLRNALGEAAGAVAAFIDITERKQTEEALRESERRLKMALDAGRMGAWEWNLQSGRVIWSPGLEVLHHLEPGTFGGTIAEFKRDIHPADLAAVEQAIERALATREDYHVTYRMRLLDGTTRWMEAFGRFSPPDSAAGERLAGICMDITERKEAEAQRDLLVAELSHRVKNTLATVNSIARQSFSMNPDARDAHRSFDARIRALAQAHTRLAEAKWSGVSLQSIFSDELAPYRNEGMDNISLDGPPTTLPPKHALTLGMAAHELATNAAKHGALSVKTGRVSVDWVVDSNENRLCIRWSETGGPPVSPPSRNGFGRLLLERVLASDLGGDVRLEFASQGLNCTIDVPYLRGAE
ncbi:PAS domain S-box protein [Ensifer sp. IC4062]|nr:PAS domain S-box protein [Ensifer sp. IC4062]MCA1439481.1 PAS domain S-box protein [Ensifer sp. IC4062]